MELLPQTLAALVLLAIGTAFGIVPVRGMIVRREALHELRHGSASFLRRMTGLFALLLWFGAIWFCATIIGDWAMTDDLAGAIDRSWLRLRILLEILAAFSDQ